VLTFDTVELNAKLDEKRFALPDDVRELLKQREQLKKAEEKAPTP
jgi:MoxR-like ATPase